MASATYEVRIDLNKDGDYDHANSDITARVLRMSWNNGMASAYQEVAPPARLSLTLDNTDGALNPEDTGATYYNLIRKGQLVRVRATYSSTTYTLFIGRLRSITVDVGTYGGKAVTLAAEDLMHDLLDTDYLPPYRENVTTSDLLLELFGTAVVAIPYASNYWILGVSGYSELGTNTILLGGANVLTTDTGKTTLAYVGDYAGDSGSVSAQTYIRDVVAAECGGRFFFDGRTGLFTFHNRHHDTNYTVDESLTATDVDDTRYIYYEDMLNRVTVRYTPRRFGDPDQVLWASDEVIELAIGQIKTFTVRYVDPDNDGLSVGGKDFRPPRGGLEYLAYGNAAATGEQLTAYLTVSVEYGGTAAKVTLINSHPSRTLYITKLELTGTPAYKSAETTVESFDPASYAVYDIHEKNLSLKLLSDNVLAQNYADALVAQFKDPLARLAEVTFTANKTGARMTRTFARVIGDVVNLSNSSIDHDSDYVIVGERHQVTAGGEHTHTITWILKPLQRSQYWVLGVSGLSELGTTTILAF